MPRRRKLLLVSLFTLVMFCGGFAVVSDRGGLFGATAASAAPGFRMTLSSGFFSLPANAVSVDWAAVNKSSSAETIRVTVLQHGVGVPPTATAPGPITVTLNPGETTQREFGGRGLSTRLLLRDGDRAQRSSGAADHSCLAGSWKHSHSWDADSIGRLRADQLSSRERATEKRGRTPDASVVSILTLSIARKSDAGCPRVAALIRQHVVSSGPAFLETGSRRSAGPPPRSNEDCPEMPEPPREAAPPAR
jgi:hypothetical protein